VQRQHELRAAGELAGDALAGVTDVVADTHISIVNRLVRHLPAAAPVATVHKAAAGLVYAGVSVGLRALAVGTAEVLARRGHPEAPAPSTTPGGRAVLPVINGFWGDHVEERHPMMAVPMAVRVDGHDVALEPALVAQLFPQATGRIVVFLHGLVESEDAWKLGYRPDDPDTVPYGQRLHDDLGFTPVYVRYNAGLRVSENGRRASDLLARLHASWPVPVEEIVLIGHSMGGLVSRSACHYGTTHAQPWVTNLTTVVTLGTPHLGAPLEQGAHVAHLVLRSLPETEPLSRILGRRSVGIKDLRYGHLVDEDWHGHDADEFLKDRSTEVPFVDHATYYFVAASLTRDLSHPAGHLLGDGMVRYPSASGRGRGREIPFEIDNGAHIGGLHHLSLLNHPAVYEQLRRWLGPRDAPSEDRPGD
jgi:pimeloyl-ACP methyl ester carboxylesterase